MKVALIGYGKAGKNLYSELINNKFVSSIHVYDEKFSSNKGNISTQAKNTQFYTNKLKLNISFDLAVIATPDHLHFEYLLEAVKLGINCFVEKPFLTNSKDLTKIISELIKKPNINFTSNLILRGSPLFRELKKLWIQDIFGSKVFMEGKYLYGRWEKVANGWRGTPDYSVLLGGLIHLVDLVCFITNNYDFKSNSKLLRLTNKSPNYIKDFGKITLQSSKVGIAELSTTFSSPVIHRRDLAIYGDNSWIEIKGEDIQVGGDLKNYGLQLLNPRAPSYGYILNNFINDIYTGNQKKIHYPNLDEVVKVLKICSI